MKKPKSKQAKIIPVCYGRMFAETPEGIKITLFYAFTKKPKRVIAASVCKTEWPAR